MEDSFKRAVAEWLNEQDHFSFVKLPVKEVTKVEQVEAEVLAYFCGEGTCWETEIHVRVYFIDGDDRARDYDYEGSYVKFIRELAGLPNLFEPTEREAYYKEW